MDERVAVLDAEGLWHSSADGWWWTDAELEEQLLL